MKIRPAKFVQLARLIIAFSSTNHDFTIKIEEAINCLDLFYLRDKTFRLGFPVNGDGLTRDSIENGKKGKGRRKAKGREATRKGN